MGITMALLPMEVHGKEVARIVSIAAVGGTASPGAAGQRIATTTTPAAASAASAFAFSGFRSYFLLYPFTTNHSSLLQGLRIREA